MCDTIINVRNTWKLVSQFVSWEFCRYMCEHNVKSPSDVDVLVLLRNMIVQRTEKTVSEVTKHEIIAKFLMELKAVDETRLPVIIALSETVTKICPELEDAVTKLMHHMTTFLKVLYHNQDCLKQDLIKERIDNAIHDFSKECEKLLPHPDLLQIIESWNHQHNHPKQSKKVIYNAWMFEKVLECLHFESITPSEAKLIALSLHEDKYFEKILQEAEAEPEADSELFSMQSSQPTDNKFSQEFEKNTAQEVSDAAPNLSNPNAYTLDLNTFLEPNEIQNGFLTSAVQEPPLNEELHASSSFKFLDKPPDLVQVPLSPPLHNQTHADEVMPPEECVRLRNQEDDCAFQFAQPSAKESDLNSCETSLQDQINAKLTSVMNEKNKVISEDESSDTSDCEKNPEYRFLTPTIYRQDVNTEEVPRTQKVIWLSDSESFNSSINTTTGIGSQKSDPNWTEYMSLKNAFYPPKKTRKKNPSRKKVIVLSDTEDEQFVNDDVASSNTNANRFETEDERPTKRRRLGKTFKLYRSPNLSLADFHLLRTPIRISHSNKSRKTPSSSSVSSNAPIFSTTVARQSPSSSSNNTAKIQDSAASKNIAKRPVSVALSDAPIHRATNTRSTRSNPAGKPVKPSNKRHKCKHCSISYKTKIALKRHIFLKHTTYNTPDDDDVA